MSVGTPDEKNNGDQVPGDPGAAHSGTAPDPWTSVMARDRFAKGLVMFVLAILVLLAGIVGYVTYDDYVEPNMPVFVCCVPSVIVASALLFFGVARRWTMVRQVKYPPHRKGPPEDRKEIRTGHSEKRQKARKVSSSEYAKSELPKGMNTPGETRPISKIEIEARSKKIREFLKDLDEQYKDGLLMEDSYKILKNKNLRELRELENRESIREE